MPLPHPPAAVIFDMDGLLIDSESLYRDAFIAAAIALGRDLPLADYLGSIGLSGDDTRHFYHDLFGRDFDFHGYHDDVHHRFSAVSETALRLKAGAEAMVAAVQALGLPLAVATSSGHDAVQRHLGRFDLHRRFDTIVAKGDYPRGKPDPAPFVTAAGRLGVPPEACLVLEDSFNGIRAAAGAGAMPVMVPDLCPPTEEIRALCVHVATDLDEARALLLEAHAVAVS